MDDFISTINPALIDPTKKAESEKLIADLKALQFPPWPRVSPPDPSLSAEDRNKAEEQNRITISEHRTKLDEYDTKRNELQNKLQKLQGKAPHVRFISGFMLYSRESEDKAREKNERLPLDSKAKLMDSWKTLSSDQRLIYIMQSRLNRLKAVHEVRIENYISRIKTLKEGPPKVAPPPSDSNAAPSEPKSEPTEVSS